MIVSPGCLVFLFLAMIATLLSDYRLALRTTFLDNTSMSSAILHARLTERAFRIVWPNPQIYIIWLHYCVDFSGRLRPRGLLCSSILETILLKHPEHRNSKIGCLEFSGSFYLLPI